jgi:hypothetical protein
MSAQQTPARGGKRPGAGRPPGRVSRSKPVLLNLLPETIKTIRTRSKQTGQPMGRIVDQQFTPPKP